MEFFFIHKEWIDKCILNKTSSIILRKNIQNEKGSFIFDQDNILIKWDKWKSDDLFEKYKNFYVDIRLKNNNQFYFNEKELIYLNDKQTILINHNNQVYNLDELKIGYLKQIEDYFIIHWKNENNNNDKNIYCLNQQKYYEVSYHLSLSNNLTKSNDNNIKNHNKIINLNTYQNNNQIQFHYTEFNHSDFINQDKNQNNKNIFKKIDNCYYNLNYIKTFIEDKKYTYDILEKNKIMSQINNKENYFKYIQEINYNYIDKDNFIKYKHYYFPNYKQLNDKFLNLRLNINIPFSNLKPTILTISEWGYPAFGGGENWLLNMNKIFYELDYECYMICFSNGFKGESFKNLNYIKLDYLHIIQMPFDYLTLFKFIQMIQPQFINHQGVKRYQIMQISNILEIPFITGFCFWNNILQDGFSNINILNNNHLHKDDLFHEITEHSYSYASSQFVNDVIYKFFNKKIDVIETISLKDDYYVQNTEDYYVTLLNCHFNKGGFLLEKLIQELNINIPLFLVYTEFDDQLNLNTIQKLIDQRNSKKNINILFTEKQEIKEIYKKTKIILIPSLCDETFCRVGYEAKMNNILIISTDSGNLKYLLKDYALFLKNDVNLWINNIEKLYFEKNIKKITQQTNIIHTYESELKNNIKNIFINHSKSKYKLNDKHVGLIVPWADQGLGIQSRSYYHSLKNIGFNPFIFSFKPYHGNDENNYLQHDPNEWKLENVFYSQNIRENIEYYEILNFIYQNKIKKIIIIEATFEPIFSIVSLLKMMNIQIYLIVNIECVKITEINYHYLFDKILCNNYNSYFIMKELLHNKCHHLGFHLEHSYTQQHIKHKKNKRLIKFVSIGGLNSISRKNVDKIINVFNDILNNNPNILIELNVFIQGVEIYNSFEDINHKNINIIIKGFSYEQNLKNIYDNDILIHLGGQEGLGLGFYEALYLGLPILTMNWTPNNEIIKHNINGWLIQCSSGKIFENEECIVKRGIIEEIDLKNMVLNIINNIDNSLLIINNTINNATQFKSENKKIFEHLLQYYLSTTPNLY